MSEPRQSETRSARLAAAPPDRPGAVHLHGLALILAAAPVLALPFAMLGWGTVTGDADYGLYALFHSTQHVPAGSNRSFYANPTVDALLDQARTNPNPLLREVVYEEAMQIIWDEAAWLFLHSETQLVAVRDNVVGLIIHPTERYLAHGASLR